MFGQFSFSRLFRAPTVTSKSSTTSPSNLSPAANNSKLVAGLKNIRTRLELGHALRVEALSALQECPEVGGDPLVQGMLESLWNQIRRAVSNREMGLIQRDEVDIKKIKLDPDQVIVGKG